MSAITLKNVGEIVDSGITFFIPNYQRGYRWERQQVVDLLNDIMESMTKNPIQKHCLQPLVIAGRKDYFVAKKREPIQKDGVSCYLIPCEQTEEISTSFEVIDGQQRLTTIFIILKYLREKAPYSITYETRDGSKDFLEKIDNANEDEAEKNIDFYHMLECFKTVETWFKNKNEEQRLLFEKHLLENVYFIWYEDESGKPVETFTRLNIGKIALTNAELIKAMLLKQSNFNYNDTLTEEAFRLTQLEMATQWDEIEFSLQKDEFWYFIHPQTWMKPTRIDYIFELIRDMNSLNHVGKDIGNDSYTTFRYFYQYMKSKNDSHKNIWNEVRRVFQIFVEWFNDATFYHYIGFLSSCNFDLRSLIEFWGEYDKESFRVYLIEAIKKTIEPVKNLNQPFCDKKRWRPLLLLFNVQTSIIQNTGYTSQEDNGAFYKFPFHLFHKEKWDIEHVDSATENSLGNEKDRVTWLKMAYLGLQGKIEMGKAESLKNKIIDYLTQKNEFEKLYNDISSLMGNASGHHVEDKDTIGNYVLLDENTNRGYGNAIFPAKRMIIIGKDQGKRYIINDNLEINVEQGNKSFIPPCTRNVFMKYYTPNSTDIMFWGEADAKAYSIQIQETLAKFNVSLTTGNP